MHKIEYEKILSLIKKKLDFLDRKEKSIDLNKSDNYNQAILKRINDEREFINQLIASLGMIMDHVKTLEASNKHLATQNTIYFHLFNTYESEFEKEYGRTIRATAQAK